VADRPLQAVAAAQDLVSSANGLCRDLNETACLPPFITATASPDREAALPGLIPALAVADGLVHATPTDMADYPGIAVQADALMPWLWVADIVYRPLETELLRAARAAGCRTLDGGAMAAFQAAGSLALVTDVGLTLNGC
jgi:quinate/shikimate dehydrogenase (NAD+)